MRVEGTFVVIGICAAFCGCAENSPYLRDYAGQINRGLTDASHMRRLETTEPGEAQKNYERILSSLKAPDQSTDVYQKQLQDQLKMIGASDSAAVSADSILGFPQIYDRQIQLLVETHLGLARLALIGADSRKAESEATQALQFTQKAIFPSSLAHQSLECYEILRQIYAQKTRVGREKIVRLNQSLLREYLASKQGVQDFYVGRQMGQETDQEILKADDYIRRVNTQRNSEARAGIQDVLGGLQQVGSTMQQYQMDKYAAAHGGQLTPQMQTSKILMNFQSQIMSIDPSYKKGMDAASAVLSPFANPAVGQQLVNPDYGPKAPDIIKAFASSVAQIGGDGAVSQAAQAVSSSVDAVTAARTGDQNAMNSALTQFAQSFTALQAKVEGLDSGASKQ